MTRLIGLFKNVRKILDTTFLTLPVFRFDKGGGCKDNMGHRGITPFAILPTGMRKGYGASKK